MKKVILFFISVLFITNGNSIMNISIKKNILTNKKLINDRISLAKTRYNIPKIEVSIVDVNKIIYETKKNNCNNKELFLIGSNSKSLTALGVMKLIENSDISLDQKIITILPWLEFENCKQITIRHLLNHTSGIPRRIGLINPKDDTEIKSFYNILLNKAKLEIPGKQYQYSNLNYQLLGLIIEEISDEKFDNYMKQLLIDLNMKNTYFDFESSDELGFIDNYQHYFGKPLKYEIEKFNKYIVPSGFISSTMSDMIGFTQAMLKNYNNDFIVNKETFREMLSPPTNLKSNYCFGWEKRELGDLNYFRHDGLTQSFSSSIVFIPEFEIGIIILTNINDTNSIRDILSDIFRIIQKKELSERTEFFFFRNIALLIIVLILMINMIFRIRKLFKNGIDLSLKKTIPQYLKLLSALCFSIGWITYLPNRFNTPIISIIDYQPDAGYSIMLIAILTTINSIIHFTIKKKEKKNENDININTHSVRNNNVL